MTSAPAFLLNPFIGTQVNGVEFRPAGFSENPELMELVLPCVIDTLPRPSDSIQGMWIRCRDSTDDNLLP